MWKTRTHTKSKLDKAVDMQVRKTFLRFLFYYCAQIAHTRFVKIGSSGKRDASLKCTTSINHSLIQNFSYLPIWWVDTYFCPSVYELFWRIWSNRPKAPWFHKLYSPLFVGRQRGRRRTSAGGTVTLLKRRHGVSSCSPQVPNPKGACLCYRHKPVLSILLFHPH